MGMKFNLLQQTAKRIFGKYGAAVATASVASMVLFNGCCSTQVCRNGKTYNVERLHLGLVKIDFEHRNKHACNQCGQVQCDCHSFGGVTESPAQAQPTKLDSRSEKSLASSEPAEMKIRSTFKAIPLAKQELNDQPNIQPEVFRNDYLQDAPAPPRTHEFKKSTRRSNPVKTFSATTPHLEQMKPLDSLTGSDNSAPSQVASQAELQLDMTGDFEPANVSMAESNTVDSAEVSPLDEIAEAADANSELSLDSIADSRSGSVDGKMAVKSPLADVVPDQDSVTVKPKELPLNTVAQSKPADVESKALPPKNVVVDQGSKQKLQVNEDQVIEDQAKQSPLTAIVAGVRPEPPQRLASLGDPEFLPGPVDDDAILWPYHSIQSRLPSAEPLIRLKAMPVLKKVPTLPSIALFRDLPAVADTEQSSKPNLEQPQPHEATGSKRDNWR